MTNQSNTSRGLTERECPGADDPEERCPRHPDDCACWEIDMDHPMVRFSKAAGRAALQEQKP